MCKKTLLMLLVCCVATLLITACDTTPPAATLSPADTPHPVTLPPLIPGKHENIVFVSSDYNEQSNATSFTDVLQRFDVTSRKTTAILKLADISILDAQISSNGEWIVFVARLIDHDELRLVRMDGKYMQTLLYSQPYAAFSNLQWSPNQQYLLFDEEPPQSGPFVTYLLDILHSHLQVEIAPSDNARALSYIPRKWLDNSRALLVGTAPIFYATPQNVYILDIHRGVQQPASALQQVYTGNFRCADVDSNDVGSLLFISSCTIGAYPAGSSAIFIQPLDGSKTQTLFTSQKLVVQQLRFLAPHTLLLIAENELWKMNTDGTGLMMISTIALRNVFFSWNQFTQFPWSNISRDASFYGLQVVYGGVDTSSSTLYYGSLQGGKPQFIAVRSNGLNSPPITLALIGWTIM